MNYVGLFEGISGFGLAFKRAGANILAFCEIDKICQSVLRRHHPEAEIISDVKTITKKSFGNNTIDILAGGFPCQDLSVAGLRKGLAGERSGLWFEFLRVITDHKPRIVVIENVPGLLSSNNGKDFAIILQGLVKCGYGVCWRVFDSQYDGVAQRRNCVFIVASLGTASCVEILFERESSQWDSPPSREARQDVAGTLSARTSAGGGLGTDFECNSGLQPTADRNALIDRDRGWNTGIEVGVSRLLSVASIQPDTRRGFGLTGNSHYSERPATLRAEGGDCGGSSEHLIACSEVAETLSPGAHPGGFNGQDVGNLIAFGGNNQRDSTVAYNLTFCDANGRRADRPNGGLYVNETEQANTLTNGEQGKTLIATFDERNVTSKTNRSRVEFGQPANTLHQAGLSVLGQFGVRQLTPTECEALQGFPRNWTAFGDDGKPISDSARYRMLGNAVCVPTAEWIARRIVKQLEAV